MRRRVFFALAVILQIGILVAMMGMKSYTLAYGTKVLLKTRPVDPWDVFRGEYVVLHYEIGQLDLNNVPAPDRDFKRGEKVYTLLTRQGKYWTAKSISKKRPTHGSLAIKGEVEYFDEYAGMLNISYGVDSYYVPERKGRAIEEKAQVGLLDAEVMVDRWGNSALKSIFYQGKEIKFD